MNKTLKIYGFGAFVGGVIVLSACGDDVTKVTNVTENPGMEIVKSADDFEKCDSASIGKTAFASGEGVGYVCTDSGWVSLLKNSEGKNGFSCSVEMLSDSSGYQVVCGEDSIGVLKNGENGRDGVYCSAVALSDSSGYKIVCGEDSIGVILNGTNGSGDVGGCHLLEDSLGIVKLACGEADTVTLYKAICGFDVYDPAKAFCFENTLYELCDGKAYSPVKKFCREGTLYDLCGGKAYNPEPEYGCIDGVYGFEFEDSRDKQTYLAVKIGSQVWMAENLNYVYTQETATLDSSSFCFDDSTKYCEKYGRLYLWSAAMDSAAVFSDGGKNCGYGVTCSASGKVRGVCPEGWHLPDSTEWATLELFVADSLYGGVMDSVGHALKSIVGWDYDGNGSDAFGFGGVPTGYRYADGSFQEFGYFTRFWSTRELWIGAGRYAYSRDLYSEEEYLLTNYDRKSNAESVRCVKD